MEFVINDGGRKEAGYKGNTGDCVVRAIAIATGKPYQEVYDTINVLSKQERPKRRRKRSSSRDGVFKKTYHRYLLDLGFVWVPTMQVGSGCKVHLRKEELPRGTLIARLSRHLCAVIDGVVHDTHDPTRGGTRCVYGYYQKEASKGVL